MKVSSKNSSTEGQKHPYERLSFWLDPTNQFWEWTYKHRPDILSYYRNWLQEWMDNEKNYSIIDPTLK
jgi:hypothetical protein